MNRTLRESEHLIRLVVVVLAALVLFVLLRLAVVPPSFGQYGHYRGATLEENRNHPLVHAGQAACADCHGDVVEARKGGKHEHVACEACHGPLAKHAEDPSAVKPQLPNATALCQRCHEADSAKPKRFPQVVSKDHAGGEACNTCHKPHRPSL